MVTTTELDPAFSCIRKDYTGFFIWRIENFEVAPLSREQYGKFYKGDSYIIYSASESGKVSTSDEKPRIARSRLEIHIHFWLGSETNQDEAGVAAIKTIELDVALGGAPVQHREVEGNESVRFRSYFKDGIRYLKGGISSGFHHVTDEFKPSLYQVKGKRFVVVHELPKISWNLMNEGDVFVLDCKEYIYVWTGSYSNNNEKLQGAKFATKLKDEHGCGHVVIIEDGQEEALTDEERRVFGKHLPLNNKQVVPIDKAPKDEIVMRRLTSEIKLFRCTEEKGTLKVSEVKNGPFSQKDLDSNDSFIIDNGHQGVWVWVGKRATLKEREEAMRNAQGFITKKGYPQSTQVSRIVDGGEPPEFKTLFKDWRDKDDTVEFGPRANFKRVKPTVQTRFDASTLHQKPELSAKTQMFDDGLGQKEIWRIKNFDLIEVPEDDHGQFFMGDCYIILYAYTASTSERYVIYYWIGSEASIDETGTAALKTIELDEKLNGRAVQVRVTQGKEPPHFMAIFGGKMIVYEGGFGSSFDGKRKEDRGKKSSYMLQVTGNSSLTTKAIEVDFRAASLNSNDCFIIVTPSETFVWCGKGSTGDEREMAKTLAKSQGDPLLISEEGSEKDSFWKVLGGKEEYASSKLLREEIPARPPRLFQCSNASGVFKAEEIFDFCQSDLSEDDVMILDAWDALFVWLGRNSNRQEQREAENLVFDYLKTDPAGRSDGTTILKIKQGFEPPNFTGFFGAWNNNLWNENETYGDISKRLGNASPGATILVTPSDLVVNGSGTRKTYPLSTLIVTDPDKLPLGVDPTSKEEFLCDSDFMKVFAIDRDSFNELPQWKRINLKKKAGLF
ncbi:UNVERIFIED_CONTAM: hypothetical protein RMT77_006647 [Armadillidium vulgare]